MASQGAGSGRAGREDGERGASVGAGGAIIPWAASLVVGLAFIEPAMARLERLGDTLEAKQYLFIMPTGELSYLLPAVRQVPVPALGIAGAALVLGGLMPAVARLRAKGVDGWSATGWALFILGAGLLLAEYGSGGEWVFARRIGARYLAFTFLALGAFLGCRSRRFLAMLGVMGFCWDLSSAVFWAALRKDLRATVPVPWYHHFDQEEGRGAPCWAVCLVDSAGIGFFAWLMRHDFDPLDFYDD